MKNQKLTNRQFDQISLEKSKQMMWKHIKAQTIDKPEKLSLWAKFANLFKIPKFALTSAVAVMTVFALVLTTNFTGIFTGTPTNIAHADFEIIALEQDNLGVSKNSKFLIKAPEDFDLDIIKENLIISPVTEFTLEKSAEAEYTLTPSQDWLENSIYRFDLGTDSFAFQIKEEAKIVTTIPRNKAIQVPANTGIEIQFSLDDFNLNDAQKHFTISPDVKGKLEKFEDTLIFIPNNLTKKQIYEITISKGLKFGSKLQLPEDYTFKFEVADQNDYRQTYGNIYDKVINVATDDQITFRGYSNKPDQVVDIYEIPEEKYVELLKHQSVNGWASNTELKNYPVSQSSLIGSYPSERNGSDIQVTHPKLDGYYYIIVWRSGEQEIDRALLEMSDLGAYYQYTNNNLLLWSLDYKGKTIAKNTELFADDQKVATANEDGIITLKNISSYQDVETWKLVHNRRSTYLNINHLVNNFYDKLNTPNALMILDKPTYRQTDTINFHGQIDTEIDNYIAELQLKGNWGNSDAVRYIDLREPLEIMENGVFSSSFKFTDLPSGTYSVNINVDGKSVISSLITINEVKKNDYFLTLQTDKEIYRSDEYVEIEATAQFYDGTPVVGIELYEGNKTDAAGKVKVRTLASDLTDRNPRYASASKSLVAQATFGENNTIKAYKYITVYYTDHDLSLKQTNEPDQKTLEFNFLAKKRDISKRNQISTDMEPLTNQKIYGTLTATKLHKTEYQYYDYYNKVTKTRTQTQREDVQIGNFTITSDEKGEASHQFNYRDYLDGYEGYIGVDYWTLESNGQKAISGRKLINTKLTYDPIDPEDFLWLDVEEQHYSVGDTVKVTALNGSIYSDEKQVPATAEQFLFIKTDQLGQIEYRLTKEPYASFQFTKNDRPSASVTVLAFDQGVLRLNETGRINYNYADSTYKIQVNANKDQYKPGEDASLDLKITKPDNSPARNTNVNITVIDESYVDATYYNYQDPVRNLFKNVYNYSISESSHSIKQSSFGDKGGCFLPGTLIQLADGTQKPIEKITTQDIVSTKIAEHHQQKVPAKVLGLQKHLVNEYLVINDQLKVTSIHRMFVNEQWVTAGEIKVGDILENYDGTKTIVQDIQTIKEKTWVYNFEVDKYHTYFADGIYVHNDKGGGAASIAIRENFEDIAHYITGKTDNEGKFSSSFTLPDNITNWNVVSRAFDLKNHYGGMETIDISTSLPLFINTVFQDTYLQGDKPKIKVRVFGESLDNNGQTLTANFQGTPTEIQAFQNNYFDFDTSTIGEKDFEITVQNAEHADGIKQKIQVLPNQLTISESNLVDVNSAADIKAPGKIKTVTLMNKTVAEVYTPLKRTSYRGGNRLDDYLSRLIAADTLEKYFQENPAEENLNQYITAEGGYSLLPYSSADLELTALATILDDPSRHNKFQLKKYYDSFYADKQLTLDERVFTLVGYAAVNQPVLNDIKKLVKRENLNTKQSALLALALLEMGDKSGAEELYQSIKTKAQSNQEKALSAIIANGIGLTEEGKLTWQKLDLDGANLSYLNLYVVAYYRHTLSQMTPENAVVKINGEKTTFEKHTKTALLPHQLNDLEITPKSGQLAALIEYEQTIKNFEGSEELSLTRTYSTETLGEREEMIITLKVDVSKINNPGCIDVIDYLPHGLKPVKNWEKGYRTPYHSEGQKQHFCLSKQYPTIKYKATVVSTGEFTALPATASLRKYPDIRAYSEQDSIIIE